jgi:hypothetical protein
MFVPRAIGFCDTDTIGNPPELSSRVATILLSNSGFSRLLV